MTRPSIAVFGGSFNPPGIHHRQIVQALSQHFDLVLVVPCGFRPDKAGSEFVSPEDRKNMLELTFGDLPKVKIDYMDVDSIFYTRTIDLDRKLREKYDGIITHAVGSDLVRGGAIGESEIQKSWFRGTELWETFPFVVVTRKNMEVTRDDLPRNSEVIDLIVPGSSTEVRLKIKRGESIEGLVVPSVSKYIHENSLYL